MMKYSYLKLMVLAFAFVMGFQTLSAQIATVEQKQEHNQQLDDQYDMWKRKVTRDRETAPNYLISSNTTNGMTTHTIQLGWNLTDATDASNFEAKIAAQKGIISVGADHNLNKVQIVIKEEDEYDALKTYFNIN